MGTPLFIVFEGIDGAGTTTQSQRLAEYVRELGHQVVLTREPGGTPLAERIRALVLEPTEEEMVFTTELLLYSAGRAQHVGGVIAPSLAAGTPVICDRFTYSTLAYQGYGRQLDLQMIETLNDMACGGTAPDLTIFMELSEAEAVNRRSQRDGSSDRIEAEGDEFLGRVQRGYAQLARESERASIAVDSAPDVDTVGARIKEEVTSRWPGFPYRA